MTPDLSVIVPLYNEEESVGPLHEAIVGALDPLGMKYEMLFVDDGSKDATFRKASEIAMKDRRLRVIKFRRNYGQTPAMAAGIDHARGRILITMDGDLQNDPADIPKFLEKIAEGNDVVCGWRHKRQDTFYQISNFDWSTFGETPTEPDLAAFRMFVNGVEVETKSFPTSYLQGGTYHIKFTFGPAGTIMEAFGQSIPLSGTGSSTLGKFEIVTGQQDAYYDNIRLEAAP